MGTLEPGSCSEGQLEPPGPCVQAPPPLVPAGPRDHAKRGSQPGGESRRAGSDPSGPEGPLEATTELTQFPTQGKGARWGVSGTGWRLVFEPWGSQRPRVPPFEHLSILGLSLPGLKAVARLGSRRRAQGARLARLPHPPALAANGSSSPALRCPGRRGLGRIKQPEGRTQRSQRARGSRAAKRPRGTLWGRRVQLPRAEANPESVASGTKYTSVSSSRGAFRRERRPARDRFPELPITWHRCAHSPKPARIQPQSAARARAATGPWAPEKPQQVHRCSLHR